MIINDLREQNPDLDGLRRLYNLTTKEHVNILDAIHAAKVVQQLEALDLDHRILADCLPMLKQYGKEAPAYLMAAMRFYKLVQEKGKPYYELLVEYESKGKAVSELEQAIKKKRQEAESLTATVRDYKEMKSLQDRLDENRITPTMLDRFITDNSERIKLGFTNDVAIVLAQELFKTGLSPEEAGRKASALLAENRSLEDEVRELRAKVQSLKQEESESAKRTQEQNSNRFSPNGRRSKTRNSIPPTGKRNRSLGLSFKE